MVGLDPALLIMALRSARSTTKQAFVPSDAAAGPPPGDPSGGGMPPGGDPSGGGAPPPDPAAAGGGAPPPSAPPPPDPATGMDPTGIAGQVASGVSQALAMSGLKGGGMGPNGKPTAPKPDINTIATDVFQLKKLVLNMFRRNNWEIPPEILDGPNRDPLTGAPAMSPGGGSDVQPGASTQPGQGDPSQAGGGMNSAISPIQPMQGAFPSGGGGGGMGKTSSAPEYEGRIGTEITGLHVTSKAAALAHMFKRRRQTESASV